MKNPKIIPKSCWNLSIKIGFVTAHLTAKPAANTGIEINGFTNKIIVNPKVYNIVAPASKEMILIDNFEIKAPVGINIIRVTNQNIPLK